VAGVSGDVDTNFFNGKREWLQKLTLLRDAPSIADGELSPIESVSDLAADGDFGAQMGDGVHAR
jgi:hypothetical protein